VCNNNEGENDVKENRQYVWLVRYGRTHPGLIENVGNYDSDLHYPQGYDHAKAMVNRMVTDKTSIPKRIYTDPFLRCIRTAHILTQNLNKEKEKDDDDDLVSIKVEEGITEWQVPSLLVNHETGDHTSPRTTEQLQSLLSSSLDNNNTSDDFIDTSYQNVNPQGPRRSNDSNSNDSDDDDDVRPRFPETEHQLHRRCRTTLERILNDTTTSKGNTDSSNVAIVSHAPCIQSMVMALEGATTPEESKIVGSLSLGGMTLFSRPKNDHNNSNNKWTLEFFDDTSHMPGDYQNGIGKWSLPSFIS